MLATKRTMGNNSDIYTISGPAIDLGSQRRVPRGVATGRASVRADGELRLSTMALTANARVDGSDLEASGASAKSLVVDVTATGTAQSPQLAVRAQGSNVVAPNGMAVQKLTASSRVAIAPTPLLTDVQVLLDTQHSSLQIGARSIRVQDGVQVDGARIDGLGQPIEADVAMSGGRLVVKLHATDVDLDAVGHLLATKANEVASATPTRPVADEHQPGVVKDAHAPAKPNRPHVSALPVTGRVSLDVDLVAAGRTIDGHAEIHAHELAGFGIKKGVVDLHGSFQGETSGLTIDASAAPYGTAKIVVADLKPDGAVLDPGSWERATFGVKAEGSAD
ncbi:MAG: hypothetical protein EOP08_11000, partial [Proteobacteria bacterium]